MAFPPTRLTLIRRLAAGGSESDWREFLLDYWGPLCRFASRQALLPWHDAEDVAAQTFEILLQSDLLRRWQTDRTARLRTLLCSVVRNLLANRQRVAEGRRRLLQEQAQQGGLPSVLAPPEASTQEADAFYAAWADEFLHQTIQALMRRFHREGKGDYFRVLYGRVCEAMTVSEISAALDLTPHAVENHLRAAKKRLGEELRERLRRHVERYCDANETPDEFTGEWSRLGDFLRQQGGLEQAIRRSYEEMESDLRAGGASALLADTLARCGRGQ